MHILMLVPYYAPDLGPAAPLFTLLSEALVKRGHKVSVIAAVPHYPSGSVPKEFRKQWIQRSVENGVEVVRIRIPSVKRASLVQRLLQYICYQIGAAWVGFRMQYDVVYVTNPSLWVWLPFKLLVMSKRKPAIFSVQDLYPDVGIILGIFRHKFVIKAVAWLEKTCLKNSALISIISDSFRPGLKALGVPDNKMVLIPNWVDTELIKPNAKQNGFSKDHNLSDRFVILYAGNIGLSQGLENVLSVAKQLENYPDPLFVFVGEGGGRENLIERAERNHLTNVSFIPFQPREKLPEVLSSASISLITLKRGMGAGSLPSKILSGLASGRPLIVSIDEGTDTWNLVEQAEAGLCVPPEDAPRLVEAILTLMNDPELCERMGKNGRTWAEKNHSPQVAAERFEQLFFTLIERTENESTYLC
jgi:colanic acid biosynthesis glycosyl transferase WcaI